MKTCVENHRKQVDQVYRKIKQLKKLYALKLPEYKQQLENSKKSSLLWSKKHNNQKRNGSDDALGIFIDNIDEEESKKQPLHRAI